MSRILVLDLDGTLVDSVPDLAAALNRLMVQRSLAPFTWPEVAAMVGDGAAALVDRAFAARSVAADAAALAAFLADYGANAARATRAFPGVEPGLRELAARGWRLAVCTNKPAAPARALLAALGLDGLFAAIGAGDSFPTRKPDPAHLLATIAAAGGMPGRAVMVGDHRNDVIAAAGAGVPCIFAGWGYGTPAMAEGAAAIVGSFAGLMDLVERLMPGRECIRKNP
jgi:phosphoglycolate phosphatase